MRKEFDKNYLKKNILYLKIHPGDNIYDIEYYLLFECNFYHWNFGDVFRETTHNINDVKDYEIYYHLFCDKNNNKVMDRIAFSENNIPPSTYVIDSTIILRSLKLKRIKKIIKCSK
jgi:hypothetical protein